MFFLSYKFVRGNCSFSIKSNINLRVSVFEAFHHFLFCDSRESYTMAKSKQSSKRAGQRLQAHALPSARPTPKDVVKATHLS